MYCSFVDFEKAFDIVPRVRLMHMLQRLGVPIEYIWGIMALCKTDWTSALSGGPLKANLLHCRVRQKCLLSLTLCRIYIDEFLSYIARVGDKEA